MSITGHSHALTPAAGFVAPWAAAAVGFVAGAVCYAAVVLKDRLRYDDSLDAFGVHGMGGPTPPS